MVKVEIRPGVSIYLDKTLMFQLDTLILNAKEDWDFVIVVTGDRMVRTGKSVLAMNLGAYLSFRLNTKFDLNNIFFDSQKMIDFAQHAPTNSVVIYDEGREGLAASKTAKQVQKDLLDYFSECGQLNHIFIIVLPDFFGLKEEIAVARAEYLINVWRAQVNKMIDMYKDGEKRPVVDFKRGYFEFFNRAKKASLYDKARTQKRKNYQLITPNFKGRFTNFYPVDEQAYRKKKKDALARFQEKKDQEYNKKDVFRDKIILDMHTKSMTQQAIADKLGEDYEFSISRRQIGNILKKYEGGSGLEGK